MAALFVMLRKLLSSCRLAYQKRRFRAGATLSHFVARDIRREIEVLDASEVAEGFVRARSRTWNVLYASKGLAPKPEFGECQRMRIDNIWDWKGPVWGGPVPHDEQRSEA